MAISEVSDRIHIRELKVRCALGIEEREKTKKQDVSIDITLHTDLSVAGRGDSPGDAIDIDGFRDRVVSVVEGSEFSLMERVAQAVAEIALSDPRIDKVEVAVERPGALHYARSLAVEITRTRRNI